MHIRDFLENRVKNNPEKIYLYFKEQEITYEDFNKQVNKTAHCLWDLGIRKGDNVAIMLPNCPEFLYTWFGLNKIGAVEVPINHRLGAQEVKYILSHSEAKAIVIHHDYFPLLSNIRTDLSFLRHSVVVGSETPPGSISFWDYVANAPEVVPTVSLSEDDLAVIIYTSGTTGSPKGVMHSHKNWVLTGESWSYTSGICPNDRIMTSNPLSHANAQCYSTMGSLAAGASLILLERFSRSNILEQARHYKATVLVAVAAAAAMIWSRPPQEDDWDNPLRLLRTGGVPAEIYEDFEKRFQLKLHTGYSLTEAPFCITAPREGTLQRKPTPGIGIPAQHPDPSVYNEAKIVNKAGIEVPRGVQGEIIVRNPAVMIGYFKDPEKTAETKRDGWIYTGDLGYQDEDGYFFFVGRKKDVLRRRGELISPAEIESVITTHPKVLDSAVLGVPSGLGTGEEEIKAYVRLKPGESVTPQEIINWCSERLAGFKVPRYLEFRTDFPTTSTGKIQKDVLKAEKKDLTEGCYDRQNLGEVTHFLMIGQKN